MEIRTKNKALKWLFNREFSDERVEFINGVATVSKEVGDKFLAAYPDLAEVQAKKKEE